MLTSTLISSKPPLVRTRHGKGGAERFWGAPQFRPGNEAFIVSKGGANRNEKR